MNTYVKYCPNVFLAKCEEKHEKGEVITLTTKYGRENEHIVHNLIGEKNGFYFYSITRVDGYNCQERAKRKAEHYQQAADRAEKRSDEYMRRSQKDSDFLSLGEPIKIGHHSEKRHRKAIDDAWKNTGKSVAEYEKAVEYSDKADGWLKHANDINLSMPESIGYYADRLEKAKTIHKGMLDGTIPREHAYSLTYAKKAVNEAQKNYDIAVKLWG